MTKVRIRRVLANTAWQLVTFTGKAGGESRGIVDLLAIRKDHRKPGDGLKRGDRFEVVLIQVKGGGAALPTPDDLARLRRVGRLYHAKAILLACWNRGRQAQFYQLRQETRRAASGLSAWKLLDDMDNVFR